MRIGIFGGTGYLGSKLIRLLSNDNEIVCIKRKTSMIESISDIPDVSFVDIEDLERYNIKMDVLINTACMYQKNNAKPSDIYESNLFSPIKVFEWGLSNNVRRIITTDTGLPDSYNDYSFSKKMLREYGGFISERDECAFINISLENYYGADEPRSRFIHATIDKLKCDMPVDLTEGSQKRDFIHIDDVVKSYQHILNLDLNGFHNIPLGSGEAPSIREVISYLKDEIRSKSVLNFGKVKHDFVEPDCCADRAVMKKYSLPPMMDWRDGFGELIKSECDF